MYEYSNKTNEIMIQAVRIYTHLALKQWTEEDEEDWASVFNTSTKLNIPVHPRKYWSSYLPVI